MTTTAKATLYKSHSARLLESAINTKFAESAGIYSIAASNLSSRLSKPVDADAIAFQYHRLDGTKVPSVRYLIQTTEGESFSGLCTHPYVPPGLAALMPHNDFVIIVVGEVAAAAGVSNAIGAIGLSSSAAWIEPEQLGMRISSDCAVHPMIIDIAKKAGKVLIVGDSMTGNKRSLTPEDGPNLKALAEAIRRQTEGLVVAFMTCPSPTSLKAYKKEVVTLDSWIYHLSTQVTTPTKEILALMRWRLNKQVKLEEDKSVGGYHALGVQGSNYVAWSNRRCAIDYIPRKDMFNKAILSALASREWCQSEYTKTNAKGDDVGIDYEQLAGDIMTACESSALPPFSLSRVVAGGVYLADDSPDVVVVNGSDVFRSDGKPIDRVTAKRVYVRSYDLGVDSGTEVATTKEVEDLLYALDTWNWSRPSDSRLFLGQVTAAFCSGAHRWRPHCFIHGIASSGKSHLMKFAAAVLGQAGRYTTGSSPASIRQALDGNAIATLCDEQGADSGHLSELMMFFKLASGGGYLEKGDAKQGGVKRYQLSTTGFVSGVHLPTMDSQQEGRFLLFSLNKVRADIKTSPHFLLRDREDDTFPEVQALGQKLFARMLRSWPRFQRALGLIKAALNVGGRMQDTFGLPLAGAWVALHDEELTDAKAWIETFDLAQDVERIRDASDNDDFLTYLMSSKISVERAGTMLSVSEVCLRAHKEGQSTGPYSTALKQSGMRIRRADEAGNMELMISPREQGFRAIFKDAKVYGSSNLTECVRRIPGASQKFSEDKFRFSSMGGTRYLTIPIDLSE